MFLSYALHIPVITFFRSRFRGMCRRMHSAPLTGTEHIGPAQQHLGLEQLLHLMLRPAVRADHRRRRASIAAQVIPAGVGGTAADAQN